MKRAILLCNLQYFYQTCHTSMQRAILLCNVQYFYAACNIFLKRAILLWNVQYFLKRAILLWTVQNVYATSTSKKYWNCPGRKQERVLLRKPNTNQSILLLVLNSNKVLFKYIYIYIYVLFQYYIYVMSDHPKLLCICVYPNIIDIHHPQMFISISSVNG